MATSPRDQAFWTGESSIPAARLQELEEQRTRGKYRAHTVGGRISRQVATSDKALRAAQRAGRPWHNGTPDGIPPSIKQRIEGSERVRAESRGEPFDWGGTT